MGIYLLVLTSFDWSIFISLSNITMQISLDSFYYWLYRLTFSRTNGLFKCIIYSSVSSTNPSLLYSKSVVNTCFLWPMLIPKLIPYIFRGAQYLLSVLTAYFLHLTSADDSFICYSFRITRYFLSAYFWSVLTIRWKLFHFWGLQCQGWLQKCHRNQSIKYHKGRRISSTTST